ncbi:hypothetical protein [Burkholderia glumae]
MSENNTTAALTDEQIVKIAEQFGTWSNHGYMKMGEKRLVAFARALLTSPRAAVPAPEGWKLVPIERSYDMRVKALLAFNTTEKETNDRDDALDAAHRAMLDAAPAAPVAAQAVAADGASTQRCNLGVGCDEAGVCYASAHGDASQCGRAAVSPATAALPIKIPHVHIRPEDEEIGRQYYALGFVDGNRSITDAPQPARVVAPKPATADELAAFLVWWTRDVPEELRRDWINRNEQFLREGKACEALARAWEGWQARASQAAAPAELRYATQLAVSLHQRHYDVSAPNWKPLPNLMGVLTQIDNMTCGLTRAAAPAEAREPQWSRDIIADLQGLFDTDGITENDSGDALIRLSDAIAAVENARPVAPADAGEAAALTAAARDVLAERSRQMEEGYSFEHDDSHEDGEIALAAGCYAYNSGGVVWDSPVPSSFPWSPYWWKPTTPRRDLVKAGALILAEIERIDRAEARTAGAQGGKGGEA